MQFISAEAVRSALTAPRGSCSTVKKNRFGFDVGATVVPIVPGAVLIDLNVGRHDIRPDKAMGYQACLNATDSNSDEGCIGAATGSHIGLAKGPAYAMKGGMGTSSFSVGKARRRGPCCGQLFLENVIDPETGEVIAGPLSDDKQRIEKHLFTACFKI